MQRFHNILGPSLTPNAILDLSIPASLNPQDASIAAKSTVRQFELELYGEAPALGHIKRLAVGTAGNDSVVSWSGSLFDDSS